MKASEKNLYNQTKADIKNSDIAIHTIYNNSSVELGMRQREKVWTNRKLAATHHNFTTMQHSQPRCPLS